MDDALRRPGGAARVQDEERIFRIHRFGGALPLDAFHQLVVVHLHLGVEFDGLVEIPPENDDTLDGGRVDDRLLDDILERNRLAAPVGEVGGDNHLGADAVDPLVERPDAEPAEDDRVDRPDAGTGEHGDDLLGDERHVDADPIPLHDAEARKTVCKPAYRMVELTVGEDPLLVLVLSPPHDRDLVSPLVLDVAVQAVVGDVEFGVQEPPRIGVVPLLHPVPGLEPLKLSGDAVPEPIRICKEIPVSPVIIPNPGLLPAGGFGGVVLRLLEFDIKVFRHPSTSIIHY